MSSTNSPTMMHRSISMPAQPQPLQSKPMKRSQERETLIEEDYYPESPGCERRKKSFTENREGLGSYSQSANNFLTTEWAGSTIELNTDLRRNEVDPFYYHRKPYRVIEKNGRENVAFKKIPEKSWRYIRDFVTTLVRWILPKRFLTYTTSITVNNKQKPFNCNEETKSDAKKNCLGDTVELSDENKINNNQTHIDNEIINDKLEISNNKRVTFSLFD